MPRPEETLHEPDEALLLFRLQVPEDVAFVDLRGELAHWQEGVELVRRGGGWREASVRVPAGVYAYKLRRADGSWLLDPANPRTRAAGGVRNSVVVVGGTDEPVLHAPCAPWLVVEDDGRLAVRAALRKGAGSGLRVRFDEGAGPSESVLRQVGEEDEHVLFEGFVPGTSRKLRYLFALDDGRLVGRAGGGAQALVAEPRRLRRRTPEWWKDAVVYTIFVDRFRKGGSGGRWGLPPGGAAERAQERERAGGDLPGIREALPYLKDLGVTVLHLTPLVLAPSAHRYDAVDPRTVDPAVGGLIGLRTLVSTAHAAGLKVLLDVTVTHVHRDFEPFRDVRRRGPESPFVDWFRIQRFPLGEGLEPGYQHYQKGEWHLPLLRHADPEVVAWLVETFEQWARLGVDGFRIDAAADVPLGLTRRICRAVRAIRPDAALFGEVIGDNLFRWTGDALDAATDFTGQAVLHDLLWRRTERPDRAAARWVRRRFARGGPSWTSVGFTATHDQPRLLTRTGDPRLARLGQLIVLARPEVPALYYGDEVGLTGGEPARGFEDAWPDRRCMPWDEALWDLATLRVVREAIAARRSCEALRRGDEEPLRPVRSDGSDASGAVLAFRRQHGGAVADVLANCTDESETVALPPGAPSAGRILAASGEATLEREALRLGPWSGAIVERVLPEPARAELVELAEQNRALCRLSWREGLTESPALPDKLYVTVTEACNIRCRHCITDAPRRTREGRARTMQPWVVEALADAFAAADYVGFVHGGESLVAPILSDVLRALRRARAGRQGRCEVHLLTNAMLLDEATTRRLVDLGVTSLAVSLDGASEATNDAIRQGSRLAVVREHVAAAVRVRQELGADLRIGISTVVGASSVHELPAMGRLALELGVDWLKVEEVFPASPLARREMLAASDPRMAQGLAGLRAVLRGTKVVLVEHVAPPSGCACDEDRVPGLAEFRRADGFANRARFDSCRMAWEVACVDPDGTVRPIDYDHPPLGSLLEAPLHELWNGPVARGLRAEALARTPAGRRAGCPRRA